MLTVSATFNFWSCRSLLHNWYKSRRLIFYSFFILQH